ncbi:hypothetical protein J6S88_04245 [bacterium]|nr:hypothetical protein [bacterium]
MELMEKIRSEKNTLDNVLSLSKEQREIKAELDKQRDAELGDLRKNYRAEKQKLRELVKSDCTCSEFKSQQKVVKKTRKQIRKIHKKYDKKFVKILCPLQRSKFREVVKLTKRDIRYCKLNKKACPKDPYINTFGKQDAKERCEVCKKHQKHHVLNHKCNTCGD